MVLFNKKDHYELAVKNYDCFSSENEDGGVYFAPELSIDMTEKGLKYLSDILQAIDLIQDFTKPISNYSDYVMDLKTQSAVERQLGIIGEAVNKFTLMHPESGLENARKIVGLRNRLIHAYDAVDPSIIC